MERAAHGFAWILHPETAEIEGTTVKKQWKAEAGHRGNAIPQMGFVKKKREEVERGKPS